MLIIVKKIRVLQYFQTRKVSYPLYLVNLSYYITHTKQYTPTGQDPSKTIHIKLCHGHNFSSILHIVYRTCSALSNIHFYFKMIIIFTRWYIFKQNITHHYYCCIMYIYSGNKYIYQLWKVIIKNMIYLAFRCALFIKSILSSDILYPSCICWEFLILPSLVNGE